MVTQQLPSLLLQLINAESEAERKDVIESHADLLLTDEADQLLADWLEQSKGNAEYTRILSECRALLATCRREGIEAVSSANSGDTSPTITLDKLGAVLAQIDSLKRPSDMPRRLEICQETLALVNRASQPQPWAILQVTLGDSLVQNPYGDRANNLEQALHHYQQALQVITRQASAPGWAQIQNQIATAYLERIRGERAENIEQAISHAEQALRAMLAWRVMMRHAAPNEWAGIQNNLASAYLKRIRGERAQNIEQAIDYFEQVLQVITRQAAPHEWALTQSNLAVAYSRRIRGEQAQNIEQTIRHAQQALLVYTRQATPLEWARTQNHLAGAYVNRIRGERAQNIEQVIHYFEQALLVYTRQTAPDEWGGIHKNLATAYLKRRRGERADNLEKAIHHGEQALLIFTRQVTPYEWANAMMNLAIAYLYRIRGERAENIEQAMHIAEQILEVRTRQATPYEWARTMMNLANIYKERIRGEKAQNVEQAINHAEQALLIFTPETFPTDWAKTQKNIAVAYQERIRGERTENLERAISHTTQALQVYTRQAFPIEWAMSHQNLAIVYTERIRGERTENLERAIFHATQALEVITHEAHPVEWAMIQNNLARAYWRRIRGERAQNIEQAIHFYQQARLIFTRQAFPTHWAMIQNNLATALLNRILGKRAENIEQAIHHAEQALQVRTRQAFPYDWAITQSNLAVAYAERLHGEQANNLEQAIEHHQQALLVYTRQAAPEQWASTMTNLANAYAKRAFRLAEGERAEQIELAVRAYQEALQIRTLVVTPDQHRQTQGNLATLYFLERHWAKAHAAYAAALTASNSLYQASATTEARQLEIREAGNLPAQATYCLAKLGRNSSAVETLEQGKARALAEALTRQEALLKGSKGASAADQAAFTAARERIRELEAEARAEREPWARDFLTVSADLRQARDELSAIVARIRQYVPDFMPEGLDLPATKSVANTLNQPLVYLLTTLHGSLALIVPPNQSKNETNEKEKAKIEALWLNDFQIDELNEILYGQDGKEGYLHGTVLAKTKVLKTMLDEIWPSLDKKLMDSIANGSLKGHKQVVLIPMGTLTLLPLHATSLDSVTWTFAPSARALQSALTTAKERHSSPLLLGIGHPSANKQKPLAFARLEVEQIAPLFANKRTYYEKQATRTTILNGLPGATHLHFSCHGTFKTDNPLDSALYLAGNDTLTLRDLLSGEIDLSAARLAVLSACQTGITDFQNVPDEAIGFPAGFLQAGVPGVISTLWSVADISTAFLLARFYRYHLQDGLAPAIALHKAQKWLRKATAKELKLADHYSRVYKNARKREEKREAARWIRYYQAYPDVKPFAHPYYWAAFTFTGV